MNLEYELDSETESGLKLDWNSHPELGLDTVNGFLGLELKLELGFEQCSELEIQIGLKLDSNTKSTLHFKFTQTLI